MSRPDTTGGIRGVLLDIEGVLLRATAPLPGAAEAVSRLRSMGLTVRFLTNTTSQSSGRIAAALVHAGIDVEAGELFTAGAVTASYLREHHPDARCLLLNDGGNEELAGMRMADPDDSSADVVVVGGGGPSFGWRQLNVALNCILGGAALVAMHGAPIWHTAEGFCLDGGAYARMLEAATGATAVVIGKPAPHMFLAAASSAGQTCEHLLMVGDDLVNDVLAAQELGMVGVQVRTGKFRPEELDGSREQPDHLVDSIADLGSLVERLTDQQPQDRVIDLSAITPPSSVT